MANIAMFMQKLNEDNERKKAEQDRLLRDIESSQSQSKVFRPMAQFIDFLSNANPYQRGTSLTQNQPKSIDEQRINTTLAGYTMPSNDEMLELLKMQESKKDDGIGFVQQRLLEKDLDDRLSRDTKDVFGSKKEALEKLSNAIDTGTYGLLYPLLSTIVKVVGNDSGNVAEREQALAVYKDLNFILQDVMAKASSSPSSLIPEATRKNLKRLVNNALYVMADNSLQTMEKQRAVHKKKKSFRTVDVDGIIDTYKESILAQTGYKPGKLTANKELDTMLEKAEKEKDPQIRAKIYKTIEQVATEYGSVYGVDYGYVKKGK